MKLLSVILFDVWVNVYLLIPVFHHYSLHKLISPDASGQQQPSSVGAQQHSGASDPGPIRATAPMWRCSRIMHMQRELHPTLLSSLEGIVDQMVWFRENWHEEVRRTRAQLCARDVKTEWVSKWIRWWKTSWLWEFKCHFTCVKASLMLEFCINVSPPAHLVNHCLVLSPWCANTSAFLTFLFC